MVHTNPKTLRDQNISRLEERVSIRQQSSINRVRRTDGIDNQIDSESSGRKKKSLKFNRAKC